MSSSPYRPSAHVDDFGLTYRSIFVPFQPERAVFAWFSRQPGLLPEQPNEAFAAH